jgi:hypothetical protein
MNDPRIGVFADGGGVETWPLVTITGRAYTRPVSTTRLTPRYFCVTDNDPISVDERDALIAELRDLCREAITPAVVKIKQSGSPRADFAAYQASQAIPGITEGQDE